MSHPQRRFAWSLENNNFVIDVSSAQLKLELKPRFGGLFIFCVSENAPGDQASAPSVVLEKKNHNSISSPLTKSITPTQCAISARAIRSVISAKRVSRSAISATGAVRSLASFSSFAIVALSSSSASMLAMSSAAASRKTWSSTSPRPYFTSAPNRSDSFSESSAHSCCSRVRS